MHLGGRVATTSGLGGTQSDALEGLQVAIDDVSSLENSLEHLRGLGVKTSITPGSNMNNDLHLVTEGAISTQLLSIITQFNTQLYSIIGDLDTLSDAVSVDVRGLGVTTTPTANSTDLVTSGGVEAAILQSKMAYGAYRLTVGDDIRLTHNDWLFPSEWTPVSNTPTGFTAPTGLVSNGTGVNSDKFYPPRAGVYSISCRFSYESIGNNVVKQFLVRIFVGAPFANPVGAANLRDFANTPQGIDRNDSIIATATTYLTTDQYITIGVYCQKKDTDSGNPNTFPVELKRTQVQFSDLTIVQIA